MWTEEEKTLLKDKIGKISYKEIAFLLNKKQYEVNKKAKELNIGPGKAWNTGTRTTKVNDNFFEIPNKLNSYWAGFLAADGSIGHLKYHKKINLQISQKDLEHLKKFVEDVSFTGKISVYTRKNLISMCNVSINSIKICEDLEKNFGVVPKKTFILEPPSSLNDEQKDCFIAGYIDGDGCIRQYNANNKNYTSIDVRGTLEMIKFIKERFVEITKNGVFGNKFKCGSIFIEDLTKNHCRYKLSGKASDLIIKKYMQYNIPLLERKWLKNLKG